MKISRALILLAIALIVLGLVLGQQVFTLANARFL